MTPETEQNVQQYLAGTACPVSKNELPSATENNDTQITGEAREFELPSVEQEIGADLNNELLDYWEGTPSIVASSISLESPIVEDGESAQ